MASDNYRGRIAKRFVVVGTAVTAMTVAGLAGVAQAVPVPPGPPGGGDSSPPPPPAPVKLTCSGFNGAGLVNWDVIVQLNPDGTAKSAAQQGDAYLTGIQADSIERTDPPTINIGNGGRSLHFVGSALAQVGIPQTPGTVSVQYQCTADYNFPNPVTPVIHLTPVS